MGLLDIFKHIPRTFKVLVGEPWIINGETALHEKTEDVLAAIYEVAVYFPITITVEGPERIFQIEMDEHKPPSKAVGRWGWQ